MQDTDFMCTITHAIYLCAWSARGSAVLYVQVHALLGVTCYCSVQVFNEAIKAALLYRDNSTDYLDEVMRELEVRHNQSLHHTVAKVYSRSPVPQK